MEDRTLEQSDTRVLRLRIVFCQRKHCCWVGLQPLKSFSVVHPTLLCVGFVYVCSIYNQAQTQTISVVGSTVDDWSLGSVVWTFTNENKTLLWVSGTSKRLTLVGFLMGDTMDACYVWSGAGATVGCALFKRQKFLSCSESVGTGYALSV